MKVFWFLLGISVFSVIVWLSIPGEEDLIIAHLRNFTEAVSFEPNIDPIAILARETQILTYFTEDAYIDVGMPLAVVRGRSALATVFEKISLDAGITVTFLDATVSFDRRLLIAAGRLEVSVEMNQKNYGTRVFDVALRQIDGNWLLTDLRVIVPVEQQIKH